MGTGQTAESVKVQDDDDGRRTFAEEYKLCSFVQLPVTFCLSSPDILCSTAFSYTLTSNITVISAVVGPANQTGCIILRVGNLAD
jgi:hypothetical protein